MSERGRDWRTILLAVGAVCGMSFAVVVAGSLVFYSAVSPAALSVRGQTTSVLDVAIPATAIFFMGALAFPAAYYSIRYLASGASPVSLPPQLHVWQAAALLLFWVGCSLLAGYLVDKGPWKWVTLPLYLLAICIPVFFVVRLVCGGLSVGSARRFWGLFSTGMAAGPGLAILAELAFVVLLAFAAVFYLVFNPVQLAALRDIITQLNETTSLDQTLNLVAPLVVHPAAFILALLFFSVFAPITEEAAKSIAVWTVFDRLSSSAQGYLAGALSGAGFGLLESLLASATPDKSWAVTLLIRGGSSMMHIAAASLTGWGIARYRLSRRVAPLLGGYAAAVALHSLWNASVVSIAFGSLQLALNSGTAGIVGPVLTGFGGILLALLCIAIPVALGLVNARMRAAIPPPEGLA